MSITRAPGYDGFDCRRSGREPSPMTLVVWEEIRGLVGNAECSWLATRATTTTDAIDECWGFTSHGPYYMIVDGDWRVIGDGRSLRDAINTTHEYEQHEDPCPHCGRYSEPEDEWRAYPITPRAWDMLTCGGRYDDTLQGDDWEFTWAAEWGAFVWIPFVDCLRCRGEGVVPFPSTAASWQGRPLNPNTHCPDCDHGNVGAEGFDWLEPPADACAWEAP